MAGISRLLVVVLGLLIGGVASAQEPKGWFGAAVQDVTKEEADKLRWDAPHGAKVREVQAGSPAEKAGLKVGDKVASGESVEVNVGNALPLRKIPLGTTIHNIELKIGKGGQLVRSAGVGAQLMAKEGDYAQVRLPSGEVRRVHVECFATVGQVGNLDHENVSFGKAGRRRWLGKKPHNRGVSMNPVDHPMGGGEGRTSGGHHPTTPWGVPTKGYKTRNNKRTDSMIVRRRNKK